MRILAVALLFLAAPWALALDLRTEVDPVARRLIEDRAAVGFVVGIIKGGQVQVIGYGQVAKGSGVVPDGNTVYEIGSITKAFTGVLLADMVQRGDVKLDAPVQAYLPPEVKLPTNGQPVTLEHLATHTSGFPRSPDNLNSVDRFNPYAYYTVDQMYSFLRWYSRRGPGKYEYSNYGMGLLGHVLMLKADKTSYDQLMLERICGPLGMRDTLHAPNADMLKRLAPPYDDVLRPARNWDLETLAGAGGIRSTVNDMIKFIRANLASDDSEVSRAMRLSHEKRITLEDGKSMGLAWNISRNGLILSRTGLTGGYRSWMALMPSRGAGVIVLANTTNKRIDPFADEVMKIAVRSKGPGAM
jgi:serine-type D-Ala-D-Ala carboxypeptidase/endopeptidase